jgi:DNA-binding MarR family transcriptional regulator
MLSLGGPQPLSRFAGLLGVERTTLTRNLRPLQDRGWVTDSASGDRRVRLLAITKRGIAAAREALPYWREAQKSIARRLGADAIQALATASQAAAAPNPKRG